MGTKIGIFQHFYLLCIFHLNQREENYFSYSTIFPKSVFIPRRQKTPATFILLNTFLKTFETISYIVSPNRKPNRSFSNNPFLMEDLTNIRVWYIFMETFLCTLFSVDWYGEIYDYRRWINFFLTKRNPLTFFTWLKRDALHNSE